MRLFLTGFLVFVACFVSGQNHGRLGKPLIGNVRIGMDVDSVASKLKFVDKIPGDKSVYMVDEKLTMMKGEVPVAECSLEVASGKVSLITVKIEDTDAVRKLIVDLTDRFGDFSDNVDEEKYSEFIWQSERIKLTYRIIFHNDMSLSGVVKMMKL